MTMTKWEPDRVIKRWLREIGQAKFAYLQTDDATYDKVVVLGESDKAYTIEFPRSTGNKESPWKIIHEVIPKQKVLSLQWYVD